jgi:hypothetical protein
MWRWGTLVAAAVALGWALARVWRVAAIGSAYRSKVLCSIVFGTGRSVDPQTVEDVSADSYRLLRLFRSHVDPTAHAVTTSLLGLRARTAIYRPGLGATLVLAESSADLPPSRVASGFSFRSAHLRSPRCAVSKGSAIFDRVVDAAFTEPSQRRRRTRRSSPRWQIM